LRVPAAPAENRFPGRLSSAQLVRVSIDPRGQPFRVVDVDRIAIAGKGDYSFVLGAPVEDVRAAAGSDSEPGLRSGAVIWQGFSPGRRVLGATITLRTQAAVSALPLQLEIDGSQLRLVNMTGARATTVDANVKAVEIAQTLDAARAALEDGIPAPAPVVKAVGAVRDTHVIARVPVHVRGTIRFEGRPPRPVAAVVRQEPVRIEASGHLKALQLSVSLPEPASILRPAGARRWLDLARSGRLSGGRRTTRLAVNRLLAAGLALQYQQFLPNPDLNGVTQTSYRYELAGRVQAPSAERSKESSGWLVPLVAAVGLAVVTAGAVVLWAHS
jgi:hypothetical protein